MGVIMQAFYWDCPKLENQEFQWWNFLETKVESLVRVGFTALWLPPANKAANLDGYASMGYDPYDYYDLGEFDQKNHLKTWFGSKDELVNLITKIHQCNMEVYADLVLNHCSGGDEEVNPDDNVSRWTKFDPQSGKFRRNWECFHPSPYELYESPDKVQYGDLPDLCHKNPYVYEEILKYVKWLIEEIKFDGFRYDFVKGYGTSITSSIQTYDYEGKTNIFGVGEYFDGNEMKIDRWLNDVNSCLDNEIKAFDFPLRFRLQALCDDYDFDVSQLSKEGVLAIDSPNLAVTFVDNHDTYRKIPFTNEQDKILAYAFILTHEGYPCIYWYDYYNLGLARENTPNGIEALVGVHERYAGGNISILYEDHNLYIMQRGGIDAQNGLIFVLNNSGDGWNGNDVETQWNNTKFTPVAYASSFDNGEPLEQLTNENGIGNFSAPPRGYCIYVPNI